MKCMPHRIITFSLLLLALCLQALPAQAESELREQLRQLSNQSEHKRIEAGNWFAAHGREHMPELRELLQDHDAELSYGSALALGLMGKGAAEALPDLVDQLTNPDITDVVVQSIMRVTDNWQSVFSQLTHHKTPYGRQVGARAYGLCGRAEAALPQLTELLADPDADVAKAASRALVWYPNDAAAAVPGLEAQLKHSDPGVRATALFTLEMIEGSRPERAAKAVRALLDDPEPQVRSAAISTAVRLSPQDTALVTKLTAMLEDEDPVVRVNAAFTLARFGERAAPAVGKLAETLGRKLWYLAPYSSEMATNNVWAPLAALGAIGSKASPALPQVRALLDDPYHALNAAEAIWQISGDAGDLIRIVEGELESGDSARILEGLGVAQDMGQAGRELLPDISRLLLSQESVIRQASVEVMSVLADDPGMAAEMYGSLLGEASPDERLVILNRLREFGADARVALDDINLLLSGDDDFELALAASTMYTISGELQPSRDVLLDVLSRDNEDALAVAAHCLRLMGRYAEPALARLREIAADNSMADSARNAAQRALDELGG
ncbi:MAG: HEAT repeat domain-containing protein [bacterium]